MLDISSKIGQVYIATNLYLPNEKYVGQTTQRFEIRQRQHIKDSTDGKGSCPKFYQALRYYGIDCFKWEIAKTIEPEDQECDNCFTQRLVIEETRLIDENNSVLTGYNMNPGISKEKAAERYPCQGCKNGEVQNKMEYENTSNADEKKQYGNKIKKRKHYNTCVPTCNQCNEQFNLIKYAQEHLENAHQFSAIIETPKHINSLRGYCPYKLCTGLYFEDNVDALKDHLDKFHSFEFTCSQCPLIKFGCPALVVEHVKNYHIDDELKDSPEYITKTTSTRKCAVNYCF